MVVARRASGAREGIVPREFAEGYRPTETEYPARSRSE